MMNKLTQTLPANTDKPCACCGRIHRKLFLTEHGWMGTNCREDYGIYKKYNGKNPIFREVYAKQFAKIENMLRGA